MNDPILEAKNIEKWYGPTPALRDMSLVIGRGEIVAVTGPSGCGKSTLLHCLSGILRPDQGSVQFQQRDITNVSEATRSRLRRTAFGVLFQFGQIVPELTAVENVTLPLQLGGSRFRDAAVRAQRLLDRLGVGDLAGKRPGEMSGGQQQRVALARALVTEPEVLFADEPTGALDSLAGEQVMVELVRLAGDHGTTVLVVTHNVQVAAYADREITMRDGQLETAGQVTVAGEAR
ncbi:ABC transporter ATP-binding protein [Micromonospora craterilacus]|uniref:ABC transporter ATP-binding protein n=1 Tax=Micromonospora craterilacus TaxID=1655439 RepID=A0A2W2DSY6_9ACTN|nr:ABC transporter ATP-binding protein [Micromonospora craterilacus]PZG13703.1 ABC transporter ATP-binding protein [Micromonospora craterilacus]